MSGEEPAPQMAQVKSPQMISTVKLPMLKKGEYTLRSMRMEQYLTNTDYGLWQVETDIRQKDEKTKPKTTRPRARNGRAYKDKVKSKPKSTKVKVKADAVTEEIFNGPPLPI
ncbi:hypothetical protein Tco_0425392 [Tanacetum coccineum]